MCRLLIVNKTTTYLVASFQLIVQKIMGFFLIFLIGVLLRSLFFCRKYSITIQMYSSFFLFENLSIVLGGNHFAFHSLCLNDLLSLGKFKRTALK